MAEKRPIRMVALAVLVLFLAAYAIDFHADIRGRDAFSWMDPAQYYTFARAIRVGETAGGGFDVASAFPYLVAPFLRFAGDDSIPAALAVNLASAAALVAGLLLVARASGIASPPALPVLLVLTAPLLVGLSRELYAEFTLTAIVTILFALWMRTGRFRRKRPAALFALLFAAALATKMTAALFFAGPALFEAVSAIRARERGRLAALVAALVLPAAVVAGGIYLFFPESFRYYASLGNTRIPIMNLIGPPELLSLDSITYYPLQIGRTILWGLAPFLLVPILLFRRLGGRDSSPAAHPFRVLWLWFASPLFLLTFETVKEPRHVAPVVVPAVLLIVAGVERIRSVPLRKLVAAAAILVATGQYLAVTHAGLPCPYRFTSSLGLREAERAMVLSDPERDRYRGGGRGIDIYRWRFPRSIALSGFGPNEALAVAWYFSPAVVCDIGSGALPGKRMDAYARFEDLFYFTALNLYNRRAGWPKGYYTLSPSDLLGGAEFLLVKDRPGGNRAPPPAGFVSLPYEGNRGDVRLFRRRDPPAGSYRETYAREFLRRATAADHRELSTIYFSLFMIERLRGVVPEREKLLAGFPERFEPGRDVRNIFWITHELPLRALAWSAYEDHLAGRL